MVTLSGGIRLTQARRLNYGGSVGGMRRDSERLTGRRYEIRGCAAVCLLLIALLLYNPFFTVLNISQDLSVQHPLSYRATIAGSELRRATFEAGKPLLPALSEAVLIAATLLPQAHEVVLFQAIDSDRAVSQELCDSIWFRPPPSA